MGLRDLAQQTGAGFGRRDHPLISRLLLRCRKTHNGGISIFRSSDHAGDVFPGGPGGIMSRIVRCSLIQARNAAPPDASLEATKKTMLDKHAAYIQQAAEAGAQICCLQEIFYGPYFCAEQTTRWYDFTERIPDGPTIRLMQDLARRHRMAMIVPIYEVEQEGIYYNTAAVIQNDGTYLGKYRKTHI